MTNYIDGFTLPIPRKYLNEYVKVAEAIGKIWLEHGALAYYESVGEGSNLEGKTSFSEGVKATDEEVIIFGWVVFDQESSKNRIGKLVAEDPRISDLLAPLINPNNLIFDASRMIYGGFTPVIQLDK